VGPFNGTWNGFVIDSLCTFVLSVFIDSGSWYKNIRGTYALIYFLGSSRALWGIWAIRQLLGLFEAFGLLGTWVLGHLGSLGTWHLGFWELGHLGSLSICFH
jgi:hypothetical protein